MVGSDIAERAAAVGMRVIGVDPKDIAPTAAVQRIVPPDMLLEVLPQANVQNSTCQTENTRDASLFLRTK